MDTHGFALIAAGVILFGLVSKKLEGTIITAPMVFAAFENRSRILLIRSLSVSAVAIFQDSPVSINESSRTDVTARIRLKIDSPHQSVAIGADTICPALWMGSRQIDAFAKPLGD